MAVTLAFVIAFSLLGLVQKQRDAETSFHLTTHTALSEHTIYPLTHFNMLTFPTTLHFEGTLAEKAPLPENATRTEIYNFINANPGIQFRAICSNLALSIGVVQFHIAILQKNGLVRFIRKGKYKRFFTAGNFSKKQMETIATLRLNTVKNILKTLLQGKQVSHHQLAIHLSISSQGLTWQMNRLREAGIIQEKRNGTNLTYNIQQTHIAQITKAITYIEQAANIT
jgi:predicted transcriptional regulator